MRKTSDSTAIDRSMNFDIYIFVKQVTLKHFYQTWTFKKIIEVFVNGDEFWWWTNEVFSEKFNISLTQHNSQLEMMGVLTRKQNRVNYYATTKTSELDATTFMDTIQTPATQIKFIRELRKGLECSPMEFVEKLQRRKSDTASFEDEFQHILVLIDDYYGIKKTNILL